jgi:predicted dinucleotide-binding enzyme
LATLSGTVGRARTPQYKRLGVLVEFGAPKIEDAVRADIIFLARLFAAVETFGPVRDEWRDKIVVDATDVYHVPPARAHGVDGGGLGTGSQIGREGDSFYTAPRMALTRASRR